MELERIRDEVFPRVFGQLPVSFASLPAKAMMLAIGLQESHFEHRVQVGGPAHGYWQFEKGGGCSGVLRHVATKRWAEKLCVTANILPTAEAVYEAIVEDDILAAGFARLLLYTLPGALPEEDEVGEGWRQYREAWRPGLPHRETWDAYFTQAWEALS